MAFVFSVSGSTVLSERQRLRELFRWHSQAIEIGDLLTPDDLNYILRRCRKFGVGLGIHSPLYTVDDRHGLLWEKGYAWDELERNLQTARAEDLDYVLVHFPYVWDEKNMNVGIDKVRAMVPRMKQLERDSGIPIICEPKLGPKKDPTAFTMLRTITKQELSEWELSFCLDVGDIFLACRTLRSCYEDIIAHLAPWCRVVHLHQVWFGGTKYFWTPVEQDGCVPILRTMEILGKNGSDIHAVIEHTPHRVRNAAQVEEGINWLLRSTGPWKDRENVPPLFDGKFRRVR